MSMEFEQVISGDNILILGFGLEGRSTARFLISYFPGKRVTVADRNEALLENVKLEEFAEIQFVLGKKYLDNLDEYDLIIKAPGIPRTLIETRIDPQKLTSQTAIFLNLFRDQTIGITGTKGKSTTSSLISYILRKAGVDNVLLGNIGNPPLDYVAQISENTWVVFEMSAHQLDRVYTSPKISVFLNLFEEHLDHYNGLEKYRMAKYNIFNHHQEDDLLIYNWDDQRLRSDISMLQDQFNSRAFSRNIGSFNGSYQIGRSRVEYREENDATKYNFSKRIGLPGEHNLMNIMAAVCVCKEVGVHDNLLEDSVNSFKGLEHRLEYVGKFGNVMFYNDSIATIPEATIEALKTLGKVDTLILGGKDRGVDYSELVKFLKVASVSNLIILGDVGARLQPVLKTELPLSCRLFPVNEFKEIASIVKKYTAKNGICLLSPAASSYGMFSNFEERGRAFKKIAKEL